MRDFSEKLKKSLNIAIIANPKNELDSLCASIAFKQIVDVFLDLNQEYRTSIYYLNDKLPTEHTVFNEKIKIFSKIGQKTTRISINTGNVEKVMHSFKNSAVDLVITNNSVKIDTKSISIVEENEKIDFVIALGYGKKEELIKDVDYVKDVEDIFCFDKKIAFKKAKSLTEGVMTMFFDEKVKPNKLSALAFFTKLKNNGSDKAGNSTNTTANVGVPANPFAPRY